MHPDRLWLSLGPQLTATILELKSPPRDREPRPGHLSRAQRPAIRLSLTGHHFGRYGANGQTHFAEG